jgi:hypothetical protein
MTAEALEVPGMLGTRAGHFRVLACGLHSEHEKVFIPRRNGALANRYRR